MVNCDCNILWMVWFITGSLLGAALQFYEVLSNHIGVIFENPNESKTMNRISGRYISSNNNVNLASALITCFVAGCITVLILY